MTIEPLTVEQSHVLDWLHECEGLELVEAAAVRPGSPDTLGELVLLGLACEVVIDRELVGWIPSCKGYA